MKKPKKILSKGDINRIVKARDKEFKDKKLIKKTT